MTDDPKRPDAGDDVDPGPPITELRDLERSPSSGFRSRVRRAIERRSVTSQFLSVTWHLPWVILLEFLSMIFEVLGHRSDGEGDRT